MTERKSMGYKDYANILVYWRDWIDAHHIDIGEPSCWACKRHREDKYDDYVDPIKGWVESALQVCHIVPHSLGGTNAPSNLFLMCPQCHDKAPNTRSRDAFLRWAEMQRSWLEQEEKEWLEAMACYYLTADEVNAFVNSGGLQAHSDNIGIHGKQWGNGPCITKSSICAIIWAMKNGKDKELY